MRNKFLYSVFSMMAVLNVIAMELPQKVSDVIKVPNVIEVPNVIKVVDLSTRIVVDKESYELYSLLRHPTDLFKKTFIFNLTGSEDSIKVIKQTRLDQITDEDCKHISHGYAIYHYSLESSNKTCTNMDIGGIAINTDSKYHYKDIGYLLNE